MKKIKHIAFIMDGNRRWAKSRALPGLEGHRRGYNKMKEVGEWCIDRGIKYMTVYAFSTENWKRSKKEVDYLMGLLKNALTKEIPEFMDRGIRLKVIGSRKGLSKTILHAIDSAEKITAGNTKGNLNIAINYGGRLEIVEAVNSIVKNGKSGASITEDKISQNIYTAGQPEPDVLVRTSGEHRLSGFLTWTAIYTELFFVKHHWPAFTQKDLDKIIEEFGERGRRFGGN
jgi:undecaprenyl diphosphate synthase